LQILVLQQSGRVHTKFQSIIEIDGNDTLPDEDKEWFVWMTEFRKNDFIAMDKTSARTKSAYQGNG